MNPDLLGAILLPLLLILSVLLSVSRSALVNADRTLLRTRADDGDERAARALGLAEQSSRLLATVQVGRVLVHFLTAGLVTIYLVPLLADLIASVPRLSTLRFALSYLVVIPSTALLLHIAGEVLPAMVAARRADRWVVPVASIMRTAEQLLLPFVTLVRRTSNALAGQQQGTVPRVTEEEIMTLVDAGEEGGAIEEDEKQMIASIFKLDHTLVREIMVPRIDVVALPADATLQEALDVIIQAGHSRIPVYRDNIDNIAGLLYAKDLLEVWRDNNGKSTISALLRPAEYTPESKKLDDLLKELQQKKVHLAIVVDEYGGTAGIVTIEDIVEEIVGEIHDEYDTEAVIFRTIDENEFVFDARIDIDDMNEVLGTELPTQLGDTLGGFIYSQLGKVPDPGEKVVADGLQMEVLSVDEQRIEDVRVRRLPEDEPSETAGESDNESSN